MVFVVVENHGFSGHGLFILLFSNTYLVQLRTVKKVIGRGLLVIRLGSIRIFNVLFFSLFGIKYYELLNKLLTNQFSLFINLTNQS
jgi:hypothetical protein